MKVKIETALISERQEVEEELREELLLEDIYNAKISQKMCGYAEVDE